MSIPFIHEAFTFDENDEAYILWKNSEKHLSIKKTIYSEYLKFSMNEKPSSSIQFVENSQLSGLNLLPSQLALTRKDQIFFATSIIQTLKKRGYILNLSEIKSKSVKNIIEQKITAFLKMSRKNVVDGKAVQGFGNISIEIISYDDVLRFFRVSCSYYKDQHFTGSLAFSRFIQILVDE